MKKRSIAAVLLLPFVTLGIYSLYWLVSTKEEMKKLGADIPTAWLIIIPFVGIWWLWKYSVGVEKITNGKTASILAFLLLWFIPWPGEGILQAGFNELGGGIPVVADTPIPAAPVEDSATAPTDQPPTAPVV